MGVFFSVLKRSISGDVEEAERQLVGDELRKESSEDNVDD